MHRKRGSVGIPAPMTELCAQQLTFFQMNENRKQSTTSYSLTERTSGVVRVVRHDRLFTLLPLYLLNTTGNGLRHEKECVMGFLGATSSSQRWWLSSHSWSAILSILGGLVKSAMSSPNVRW